MLKNPNDQAMVTRVGDLLRKLAADPANGVASILDRQQIAAMGGASQASFIVDMKPGWAVGGALEGPIARDRATRGGTHGYAPTHPELRASFFIAGEGIRRRRNGCRDWRGRCASLQIADKNTCKKVRASPL